MKGVYACCLSTLTVFGVFLSTSSVFADEEHLQGQITVTAVIPVDISTGWGIYIPPQSIPIQSGVPLTVEAGTDTAIFNGMAYPGSIVSLLKNGVIIAEVPASPNGSFQIGLRNLNPGIYSFGIRAEDAQHLQSSLEIFTVFVSSGVTTLVNGIFLSPTITTDKVEVKYGEILSILGRAIPDTYITISINSVTKILKKVRADLSGSWKLSFNSQEIQVGDYTAEARASTENDLSSLSPQVGFIVGDQDRLRSGTGSLGAKVKCDLNLDGRVNLKDFSIMAFWYKRPEFPVKVDLDDDGKINLTDFSILAYCWTG